MTESNLMRNVKKLDIHTAQVKTATIEVKTLTIGARQVTLAVMRQLFEKDLINRETGELCGVPWGQVNYFWGDCPKDESDTVHVVWQQGDSLYRDRISSLKSLRYGYNFESAATALNRIYEYHVHLRVWLAALERHDNVRLQDGYEKRIIAGKQFAKLSNGEFRIVHDYFNGGHDKSAMREQIEFISKDLQLEYLELNFDAVNQSALNVLQTRDCFIGNWNKQHALLVELDHFFVAV